MENTGPKSYSRYTWAEELLLLSITFSFIISNNDDDDLMSISEPFARADPARTVVTVAVTPAAGTYKR